MVRNAADYSWLDLPKCPSVSNSGWLGIYALKIISLTQSWFPCHRAWLVSGGHQRCSELPPQLGSEYIYSLTICLLFTFPALLGPVPSHPDLSFLPWSWASPNSHMIPSQPFGAWVLLPPWRVVMSVVNPSRIKLGAQNIAQVWQLNGHATAWQRSVVGQFCFVPLVVLVPPWVLSNFSCLPSLNLLIIKQK